MYTILSQLDCENSQQRDLQNENYTEIGNKKTEIAQLKQCIDGNTEEINKLVRYNNVRQEEDDHGSFSSADKQKVDTTVHENQTEDLTISTLNRFQILSGCDNRDISENQILDNEPKSPIPSGNRKLDIVMDSHGNYL